MPEKENKPVLNAEQGALVVARIFDAPRKIVWRAWTDPEHFKLWWGPKDYTLPSCKIQLKVRGKLHSCMQSRDGKEHWTVGQHFDVVPMENLEDPVRSKSEAGELATQRKSQGKVDRARISKIP